MNATPAIEAYLRRLARALSSLPEEERREILEETRSHLVERATEIGEDAAIAALSPAERYARGFLDERMLSAALADGGPAATFGALLRVGSRRLVGAIGLGVTAFLFLFAAALAPIAVSELTNPEDTGLFVSNVSDAFFLGIIGDESRERYDEVLGAWLLPSLFLAGLAAILLAAFLGRIFVRLLLTRSETSRGR